MHRSRVRRGHDGTADLALRVASPNLESAVEFYRQLFDWSVGEELSDGYRLVQTAEGSIGGGLLPDAFRASSRT